MNKITILSILYWITLPIYWYNIFVFLIIIHILLELLDFITWYLSARKVWVVSSSIGVNWFIKKILKFSVILLVVVIICWAYQVWIFTSAAILLIPHFFIGVFIFLELISLTENLSIIYWVDSREVKIFWLNLEHFYFVNTRRCWIN